MPFAQDADQSPPTNDVTDYEVLSIPVSIWHDGNPFSGNSLAMCAYSETELGEHFHEESGTDEVHETVMCSQSNEDNCHQAEEKCSSNVADSSLVVVTSTKTGCFYTLDSLIHDETQMDTDRDINDCCEVQKRPESTNEDIKCSGM